MSTVDPPTLYEDGFNAGIQAANAALKEIITNMFKKYKYADYFPYVEVYLEDCETEFNNYIYD